VVQPCFATGAFSGTGNGKLPCVVVPVCGSKELLLELDSKCSVALAVIDETSCFAEGYYKVKRESVDTSITPEPLSLTA